MRGLFRNAVTRATASALRGPLSRRVRAHRGMADWVCAKLPCDAVGTGCDNHNEQVTCKLKSQWNCAQPRTSHGDFLTTSRGSARWMRREALELIEPVEDDPQFDRARLPS